MSWRYHIRRARTGVWLDRDADMRNINLAWSLSAPGELTGTLDAQVARSYAQDGRFIFDDWSSIIYAEQDSVIKWAGILDASEDIGNGERGIHARSLSGYPNGVKYMGDLTRFYQADAFDLIRLLWNTMQSDPMSNINMQISSNLSGQVIGSEDPGPAPIREVGESDESFQARLSAYGSLINDPYELAWYNTPDYGDEISKIISQASGEYDEEYTWNGARNDVTHKINLYWPSAGTRRLDLRFVEGENIATPPSPASEADEYANHVIALGAGEERHMLREEALIDDGKLKRHLIAPAKDLYSPTTLRALARTTLAVAQNTVQYDTFDVYDHPNAPIGSWRLGDEVKIQTHSGYYELNDWAKIVGWSMSPSNPDVANISVLKQTTTF